MEQSILLENAAGKKSFITVGMQKKKYVDFKLSDAMWPEVRHMYKFMTFNRNSKG